MLRCAALRRACWACCAALRYAVASRPRVERLPPLPAAHTGAASSAAASQKPACLPACLSEVMLSLPRATSLPLFACRDSPCPPSCAIHRRWSSLRRGAKRWAPRTPTRGARRLAERRAACGAALLLFPRALGLACPPLLACTPLCFFDHRQCTPPCARLSSQVWVKILEVRPEPGGPKLGASMRAASQEDGRDLDPDNTLAAGGARDCPGCSAAARHGRAAAGGRHPRRRCQASAAAASKLLSASVAPCTCKHTCHEHSCHCLGHRRAWRAGGRRRRRGGRARQRPAPRAALHPPWRWASGSLFCPETGTAV